MRTLIALFSIALLISCSGDTPVNSADKPAPEFRASTVSADENKTVANILIEGVTCDGCRGKIKKDLQANDCVTMAVLSPSDQPGLELAVIEYDPAACDHNTFVDLINTTVDGKYTATDVTVLTMEVQ